MIAVHEGATRLPSYSEEPEAAVATELQFAKTFYGGPRKAGSSIASDVQFVGAFGAQRDGVPPGICTQ